MKFESYRAYFSYPRIWETVSPKLCFWFFVILFCGSQNTFGGDYLWSQAPNAGTLSQRISPPRGYKRIPVPSDSFGGWLRNLPLKPGRPAVYLYNGQIKGNQDAHFAVMDIDVGKEDLQQCADAIIRLRAEYLFSSKQEEKICFRFTSGDKADWARYKEGYRPLVVGNFVKWLKKSKADGSYQSFRNYLDMVYRWAGSASLSKELKPIADPRRIGIGDVFIKGGFPGHAIIVVDVAENSSGQRMFLLAQSFMPAQEIHILRNPASDSDDPWYSAEDQSDLVTPEWDFNRSSVKRFQEIGCP